MSAIAPVRGDLDPRPIGSGDPAGPGHFDAARTDGAGLADTVRNLRTALFLGWRVEANWTDPLLFLIYTVVKPISSLLLLVMMITIIGAGGTGTSDETARAFIVLGSALWAMLVAGIAGPAWSVLEDRERYRMLKYLYVSPATFLVLLVGRGGARLVAGALGTVVAIVFSVIVLGLRIDLAAVSWPLLAVCLVLGIVPILAIGVLLAAVCLQTRQESWSYPDAFAGALFLVTGVVFPLAVLPDPLEALGLVNPVTWWVAGVRLALLPDGPSSIGGPESLWTAVTGSAAPDAATIVLALCVTGALATLAAVAIFRRSERHARNHGLLDRTTGS
jgi:ABC-2 type transport system permease protein